MDMGMGIIIWAGGWVAMFFVGPVRSSNSRNRRLISCSGHRHDFVCRIHQIIVLCQDMIPNIGVLRDLVPIWAHLPQGAVDGLGDSMIVLLPFQDDPCSQEGRVQPHTHNKGPRPGPRKKMVAMLRQLRCKDLAPFAAALHWSLKAFTVRSKTSLAALSFTKNLRTCRPFRTQKGY